MDGHPIPKILILATAHDLAERWAGMLRGTGCEAWCGLAELPTAVQPEVLLLEGDFPVWEALSAGCGSLTGGVELGILRVGGSEAADVCLPADVAEPQLCLVCRLLAENVHLRRQIRSGSEVRRKLWLEVLTDPLTGLPNRRAWDEALAARLASVAEAPGRLCLAILDLDHFKRVNDSCGYTVGDGVLCGVGQVLRDHVRYDDFVARLGGDEFGLLFWSPDPAAAASVVERVRASIADQPARTANQAVTASAGFHLLPADAPPLPCPADLLAAADAALREAKRRGRNQTLEG